MISVGSLALHNGSTSRRWLDYASTALGLGGGWRRIVVATVHHMVAQTVDIVTAAHCWYSIDVADGGGGAGRRRRCCHCRQTDAVVVLLLMQLLLLMRWMLLNMAVHGTG